MKKAKGLKRKDIFVPLIQVLRHVSPDHRVILLDHFDDWTRDGLVQTIRQVLSGKKVPERQRLYLKTQLSPYKDDFRSLINPSGRQTSKSKKKALAQVGGKPMDCILNAAIPLLLETFPKT